MDSEPAHEIDRVLVSADRWGVGTGEIDDARGGTAPPPEHERGSVLLAFHLDDDLFDQGPQSSLRSLSVVLGADHTRPTSSERREMAAISSGPSTFGRAASRRTSSALASRRARSARSHSASSPRATRRLSGSTAR